MLSLKLDWGIYNLLPLNPSLIENPQTKEMERTRRKVAIKRFRETVSKDKNMSKQVSREIYMLKKLRHSQYVVGIYEVYQRKGRIYVVMEYIDTTLLQLIEEAGRNPYHHNSTVGGSVLKPELVNQLVLNLTKAINWIHSKKIIHRDIKPENILVDSKSNNMKICDFGFARQLQKTGDEGVTTYVATRWYRPPELLVGAPVHTTAVDVWPIGCIWVEMVTGEPLFPGQSELDQMFLIQEALAQKFPSVLAECFYRNAKFRGHKLTAPAKVYGSDSIIPLQIVISKQFSAGVSYFNQYRRLNLLNSLLALDPSKRCNLETAITFFENPDRVLPELGILPGTQIRTRTNSNNLGNLTRPGHSCIPGKYSKSLNQARNKPVTNDRSQTIVKNGSNHFIPLKESTSFRSKNSISKKKSSIPVLTSLLKDESDFESECIETANPVVRRLMKKSQINQIEQYYEEDFEEEIIMNN